MDLSPDLRLALLELTHVLERLREVERRRSDVSTDLRDDIHFWTVVDLSLSSAREVLDFHRTVPPDFEHKPPMYVPSWDVGRRILARRERANPDRRPHSSPRPHA